MIYVWWMNRAASNSGAGELLYQSLMTSRGKVGSKITIVLIGTLAPRATRAGHWWFDLVTRGTRGTTHVQYFKGELETWDKWATIRKANPLVAVDAGFRKTLLQERDDARLDSGPRLPSCHIGLTSHRRMNPRSC